MDDFESLKRLAGITPGLPTPTPTSPEAEQMAKLAGIRFNSPVRAPDPSTLVANPHASMRVPRSIPLNQQSSVQDIDYPEMSFDDFEVNDPMASEPLESLPEPPQGVEVAEVEESADPILRGLEADLNDTFDAIEQHLARRAEFEAQELSRKKPGCSVAVSCQDGHYAVEFDPEHIDLDHGAETPTLAVFADFQRLIDVFDCEAIPNFRIVFRDGKLMEKTVN